MESDSSFHNPVDRNKVEAQLDRGRGYDCDNISDRQMDDWQGVFLSGGHSSRIPKLAMSIRFSDTAVTNSREYLSVRS
jgi:hypothetical protein